MIFILKILLQIHPKENLWFKTVYFTVIDLFVVEFRKITKNRPLTN